MKVLLFLMIFVSGLSAKAELVTSVYDGDTITIYPNEKVRLMCIDSPEIKTNVHGQKDPIKGPLSKNYLKKLIENKQVTIIRYSKDKYGRTLGRIFLDNGNEVNKIMYDLGYSKKYISSKCPWAN